MKLHYALLSAVLATTTAMAGEFESLGQLPAGVKAMEDSQLASVEGGLACGFNFLSFCGTAQGIGQTAYTGQANLAFLSALVSQTNNAATIQAAANSN